VTPPSALVVGSVALDTILTPKGRVDDALGGSAVHFSLSARHFVPVRMVGVVGEDFPGSSIEKLRGYGLDTEGLDVRRGGRSFRWKGRYDGDMNVATTLDVQLNVLGDFEPDLPPAYRDSGFVLLGASGPKTQRKVLEQLESPRFVLVDSRDFYIERDREELVEVARRARALCLNREEALMFAGKTFLVDAVREILHMGVETVVIKKAEHGALLVTREFWCELPSFPTAEVVDPTGAGDAFAGGFLGTLAREGVAGATLRRALLYGVVMGSFACEGFGSSRLETLERAEIEERALRLRQMVSV
jgi:sugar/nucleoside kinase (ribokinase family)